MKLATLLLLASMICPAAAQPAADPTIAIDKVMRVAARKLAKFDASHPTAKVYPTDAKGAEWTTVDPSDWVSGFYPGALWYVYEYAKAEKWPDADAWRQLLRAALVALP